MPAWPRLLLACLVLGGGGAGTGGADAVVLLIQNGVRPHQADQSHKKHQHHRPRPQLQHHRHRHAADSGGGAAGSLPSQDKLLGMINHAEELREQRAIDHARAQDAALASSQRAETESQVHAVWSQAKSEAAGMTKRQRAAANALAADEDEQRTRATKAAQRREIEQLKAVKEAQRKLEATLAEQRNRSAANEEAERQRVAAEEAQAARVVNETIRRVREESDRLLKSERSVLEAQELKQADLEANQTSGALHAAHEREVKQLRLEKLAEKKAVEDAEAQLRESEASAEAYRRKELKREADIRKRQARDEKDAAASRQEDARARREQESRLAKRLKHQEAEVLRKEQKTEDQTRTKRWVDSARLRKKEETLRRVEEARAGHQQREQMFEIYKMAAAEANPGRAVQDDDEGSGYDYAYDDNSGSELSDSDG